MREIKFKAWMKIWDEDELIKGKMFYQILPAGDFKTWVIAFDNDDKYDGDFTVGEDIELMQYTGIKDKKGVEVYEGDITKHKYWEGKDTYVVIKWDDGLLTFKGNVYSERDGIECENVFFIDSDNHKFEIIGDIYSNPELLSKDK